MAHLAVARDALWAATRTFIWFGGHPPDHRTKEPWAEARLSKEIQRHWAGSGQCAAMQIGGGGSHTV